ncbi:MAG: dTDP-4-dehydrorhamnose 3,5-epimerase [Sneathiella sp.]|nr:MAG: dTDP-4-dehydrorhamnose 3,5-epimerase [Sneathiella sp.]
MIFSATDIPGAYLITPERHEDERGFFARSYCAEEFADHGIAFIPAQSNISHNKQAFTLRGMHFHAPPYEETKLVSCSAGRLFDVAVDLRPASPAYKKWIGFELSPENGLAFFIPAGCAHGFLTLEDHTNVFYQMSPTYTPGHDRGFRWDDEEIGIDWPRKPQVMSDKDRAFDKFGSENG